MEIIIIFLFYEKQDLVYWTNAKIFKYESIYHIHIYLEGVSNHTSTSSEYDVFTWIVFNLIMQQNCWEWLQIMNEILFDLVTMSELKIWLRIIKND